MIKKILMEKRLATDSTAIVDLTKYQANELEFKTQSKKHHNWQFSQKFTIQKVGKCSWTKKKFHTSKADYLLRAVYVPAGNHTIKMLLNQKWIAKGKQFL